MHSSDPYSVKRYYLLVAIVAAMKEIVEDIEWTDPVDQLLAESSNSCKEDAISQLVTNGLFDVDAAGEQEWKKGGSNPR